MPRKMRSDNRSGYVGVSLNARGVFVAYIWRHGRNHCVGCFGSAEEASLARKKALLDPDYTSTNRRGGWRGEIKEITHESLLRHLRYDPDTGLFYHRRGTRAGKLTGKLTRFGYCTVSFARKTYMAHRLAYFYMTGSWPPDEIDHKDGCGSNNRFDNLRLASRLQNQANCRVRKDSLTGVKGVHFDSRNNTYRAAIRARGIKHELGRFKNLKDAAAAYARAAEAIHGEFARSE